MFQIFNLLKTLLLLLAIVAIGEATHGIDHLDSSDISELDTNDDRSYFLNIVGILFIFAVVINLAWLGVNIACLVGLHKVIFLHFAISFYALASVS